MISNRKFILKTLLFVILVVICFSIELMAQKQSEKKQPVPEAITKMEKALGQWEGQVHSETGPVVTSRELKVDFNFTKLFNDQAVQFSSTTEIIDKQKKTNRFGAIAYDSMTKELHMMLLNDSGAVYDLTGKWTNDFALNFSCNTVRNEKKIGITLWLIFKVKDQLDYSMYTSIGDELLISEKGILSRKKAGKDQK